jgi:hypothetical protein
MAVKARSGFSPACLIVAQTIGTAIWSSNQGCLLPLPVSEQLADCSFSGADSLRSTIGNTGSGRTTGSLKRPFPAGGVDGLDD